jgi:hypothetical protein
LKEVKNELEILVGNFEERAHLCYKVQRKDIKVGLMETNM